ncbi:MAG: hypothetical protein J2P22_04095 [Nocardioides sp.]|nr:hypothetical protein [Nocardioides sp.]
MSDPKPPKALGHAGRDLWREVCSEYDLEHHEELLLLEACRCADRLNRLDAEILDAPLSVTNARGDIAAQPLLSEARQQQLTMSRLLASLRLPAGEEEGRPQRRGGARGSYGVRSVPL